MCKCRTAPDRTVHYLCNLRFHWHYVFQNPGQAHYLWIRAADIYSCRHAHGLEVPAQIQRFEDTVHKHLLWRFNTLFTQPHILRLNSGRLLAEICFGMLRGVSHNRSQHFAAHIDPSLTQLPPATLSVFAGHDVTLLPLLKCLRHLSGMSDFVPTWPGYTATLTLELIGGDKRSGPPIVRWRLFDDDPVARLLQEAGLDGGEGHEAWRLPRGELERAMGLYKGRGGAKTDRLVTEEGECKLKHLMDLTDTVLTDGTL